jgi:hypothetical protein
MTEHPRVDPCQHAFRRTGVRQIPGSGTDTRLSLGSIAMLDIIMLAIGLGFFALSVGYTVACDRL